jgi:uncharacterized protein (TIGR00297 family)
MAVNDIVSLLVLLAGAVASYRLRKLNAGGSVAAFATGSSIYAGTGYNGLLMLAAFFITATWATSHKKERKAIIEGKRLHPERRNAAQVLANGGVAGLASVLVLVCPQHAPILHLMAAAALSSATADTLSSELGMVYGRRFYDLLSGKRSVAGPDGVISLEGLLIGLGGSVMIAAIAAAGLGSWLAFFIVLLAGTAGNIADSAAGAILERRGWMSNNGVNLLNTVLAALVALAVGLILQV